MSFRRLQRGQAMTEFTLTGAFILVPLFLSVPLLGKYIDIQHSTISAARYEAWEYTVWYENSGDLPDFFDDANQPVKSASRTHDETLKRFFSRTDMPLQTGGLIDWSASDANPLWTDHRGERLYGDLTDHESSQSPNEATPDPTHVFSGVLRVIDIVFEALADVMSAIGINSGFTAINVDGLSETRVSAPIANAPEYGGEPLFGSDLDLRMEAEASVLADGWNAGGRNHAQSQIEGLVPTSILNNEPFTTIQDIASVLFASPELSSGSLKFGYINHDAVPPDRLEGGGGVSCDGSGRCGYD